MGPSKSVLVYSLHSLENDLGLARFRMFVPKLLLLYYVKAHVYTDQPASIDALEDNMEAFIREIPAERLARACQNWTKQMDHLKLFAIFKH